MIVLQTTVQTFVLTATEETIPSLFYPPTIQKTIMMCWISPPSVPTLWKGRGVPVEKEDFADDNDEVRERNMEKKRDEDVSGTARVMDVIPHPAIAQTL